ncbi:uncharacterized protein LOC132702289 [Cylas formicarius]|uniref:uncharacterized protein LOC132702289 n=1 Tax=Cylas formicarius TaxID=197179 RepID=UPI0029585D47|nr:uncharacterized protein LOC132702289 [Cylas formicarius]
MAGAKRRSKVWNYFKHLDKTNLKCILCRKTIKYCGSTTNLRNHLRIIHATILPKRKVSYEVGQTFGNTHPNQLTDALLRKEILDEDPDYLVYQGPGKKRSQMWTYFTQIGSHVAKCKSCSKKLSFKGGSTFNLLRHLRAQHSFDVSDFSSTTDGFVTCIVKSQEKEIENELSLHCHTCRQDITSDSWGEHQRACKNNPLDDILIKSFIQAVKLRPSLWDNSMPWKLRTPGIQQELWREIVDELGGAIPFEKLEKNWLFLKEMFFRTRERQGNNSVPWKLLRFLDGNGPNKEDKNYVDQSIVALSNSIHLNARNVEAQSTKLHRVRTEVVKLPTTLSLYGMSPALLTVSAILAKLPSRTRVKAEIEILNLVYKLYGKVEVSD